MSLQEISHGEFKELARKNIQVKNVSRLCHAKPIVTVKWMFPGPTIYSREGDRVLINVTNHAQYNMSIHWHGLKQFRNGWADGPAYIHNALSRKGRVTREWRNNDVEEIEKQGNKLGLAPNTSDAHTINGKPGPLFPCSEKHTFVMEVEQGKTYLLRIINAALNDELFFAIAGHNMTVVEIDAVYTKPFTTQAILIAPGQTTNVLVQATQAPGRYFMAVRPFMVMDVQLTIDSKTATAILQYKGVPNTVLPILPQLPLPSDTAYALSYNAKLRSLNSPLYPANVPLKVL
ncbi:hypothetical protein DITRI_Ditri01bG0050000 [Diplodiscus trichospermus]